MNFKQLVGVLTIFTLSTSLTRADITWDWSYTTTEAGSASYQGTGTLTTESTPNGSGQYLITSMSGTWDVLTGPNAGNYTVVDISPTTGPLGGDNLLSTDADNQLDESGLVFLDSHGLSNNIWNFFGYDTTSEGSGFSSTDDDLGTFTATMVAAVPEPSQWGLLISMAFAGLLGWRRYSRAPRTT